MMSETYGNYAPTWYTPPEWWDWVRDTLQTPRPFDPCPADWGGTVDGLTSEWPNVPCYVNHPGGRGQPQKWWDKARNVRELIWCAFNVEQLRTLNPSPLTLPGYLVMPERRIKFVPGHRKKASSPSNWAVFWSTLPPKPTPMPSWVIPTGSLIKQV